MFVYKDDTSMDTRILLGGSGVVFINLRNSVESFRYEGSFLTNGWSHVSTNCDNMIGLMPIGIFQEV